MRLAFGLVFLALPALAQNFEPRSGDQVLTDAQMQAEVVGQTHVFFDDGRSSFLAGGRYSYTYSSGDTAFGRYELRPGGVVCTFFNHGFQRCDMYVRANGRLVLITEAGERFPVKETGGV